LNYFNTYLRYIGLFLILSYLISPDADSKDNSKIDSLKSVISNVKKPEDKILLFHEIANNYRNLNSDSSIHYLNKALLISKKAKVNNLKSLLYTSLGGNYCFRGEYLTSLQYLDSAHAQTKLVPNTLELANYHYYKSIVHLSIDDHDKAIEHAYTAMSLFQGLEKLNRVSSTYVVLQGIYDHLGNHEKGLEYAKKANEISIVTNDSINIPANLNNIGTQYRGLNELDSAYHYIFQAMNLNQQKNDLNGLAINYLNLASCFFDDNKIDSSEYYVRKAEDINLRLEHSNGLSNCYLLKAQISLVQNDTIKSVKYFKKVIDSTYDLGNANNKIIAFGALHDIALNNQEYKAAIEYFKAYKSIEDSLDILANQNLMDMLNLKVEHEKYETKLELENKEVKIHSHRQSIFLIILLGVVTILVVSVLLVIKLNRAKARIASAEKKLIEEKLESKNREIVTHVLTLLRRNKAITEICDRLFDIEKMATKVETRNAISSISRDLNRTKTLEVWKEFEIRFKEVNGDFHNNLLKSYPDLSQSEQRLCAFLRMNMSTKDISELIGVHPRSVDNTRSKIRKKLGLKAEENLFSFLSSF